MEKKPRMKFRFCSCQLGGLVRPEGPVRIASTDMKSPEVMTASLTGAVHAKVAAVRHRGKFYIVAPARLGGIQEVPADSLTDCMHASVWEMQERVKREGKAALMGPVAPIKEVIKKNKTLAAMKRNAIAAGSAKARKI